MSVVSVKFVFPQVSNASPRWPTFSYKWLPVKHHCCYSVCLLNSIFVFCFYHSNICIAVLWYIEWAWRNQVRVIVKRRRRIHRDCMIVKKNCLLTKIYYTEFFLVLINCIPWRMTNNIHNYVKLSLNFIYIMYSRKYLHIMSWLDTTPVNMHLYLRM